MTQLTGRIDLPDPRIKTLELRLDVIDLLIETLLDAVHGLQKREKEKEEGR